MKKLLFAVIIFFFTYPVHADRGPIIWHEDVQLSQESQKAIILHNASEEVLILGTELKANKELDMLEFIPFPSEPKVSLAKGDPFEKAAQLIKKKGLLFEQYDYRLAGKGDGAKATVPVEIRFSEKVGLHDVTVIKINDITQFATWLDGFFSSKGIEADKEKLSNVYGNARDYIERGNSYFVFDRVRVTRNLKFLEPLVYRFKTERIYYPLKTSNLIGGKGTVEFILVLPGSIADDFWQVTRNFFPARQDVQIDLSTSSKMSPQDVAAIYGAEPFFGARAKVYLQVFKYTGPYAFKDDFVYDTGALTPYPYRYTSPHPLDDVRFTPPLSKEERRDMREAFCPEGKGNKFAFFDKAVLDCWNYIPVDEYDVYAALFGNGKLQGLPSRHIVLENATVRKEDKRAKVNAAMLKDFNDKNKTTYPLENVFLHDGKQTIEIRGDSGAALFFPSGETAVSRVGFNQERTEALVWVEHVANRRSGAGYLVVLQKKDGAWKIAGIESGVTY